MWKEKYWQYRAEQTAPKEITVEQAITELQSLGLITKYVRIIGEGKEAMVLWCLDDNDYPLAVKVFKMYNSAHRTLIHQTSKYYRYEVLEYFARLEFNKQVHFYRSGIPVPKPLQTAGFAYSMELILCDKDPAKRLSDIPKSKISDPESILEQCIEILRKFFALKYVHGDFSQYNLLVNDEERVICIDFLQSKPFAPRDVKTHSRSLLPYADALKVLRKDIKSILAYFTKSFRWEISLDEVFEYITKVDRMKQA